MTHGASHMSSVIHYLAEHWPLVATMLSGLVAGLAWIKRKVINDVYMTKEDAGKAHDELEERLSERIQRSEDKNTKEHNGLRDLIITHLGKD